VKPCAALIGLMACLATAMAAAPAGAETIAGGRFGDVHVSAPQGAERGLLVLFSTLAGWTAQYDQTANALAAQGILVVGVDSTRYAATLATTPEACHGLYNDVTAISGQLQREHGAGAFMAPIVAGIGDGATLAEQVLRGAPSNTIAGAASIDPVMTLDPRFNPCLPDAAIEQTRGLPGFWSVGSTVPLPPSLDVTIAKLRKAGSHIETRSFDAGATQAIMLLALVEPHLPAADTGEDVATLPLVELPAPHPGPMLAVVISGDGGWHDLDQTIARNLQSWGVSVVGIDSLHYFWRKKSPEQTARAISSVIRTYSNRWHASSVALIGYSFGAGVLPFVYNRLPHQQREKVSLMALLGFASAADFEIKVTGWLGMPPSAAALPVAPEIDKVPPALIQCFYGEDESDSLCPELARRNVTVIRTAGGHHFGNDYEHLAHVILDGWRRRLAGG
jgi:type IV secretory pathway VirJ component